MIKVNQLTFLVLIIFFSACGNQSIENPVVYTNNQIAANGYDLVTYFTEEMPLVGDTNISVDLDDVIYQFANEENKATFLVNPDQYLPAYGGWCAYAMANDGSLMSSNPDKYEIQDGKLYLFFDNLLTSIQGGLQKEWNADPATYQLQADDNWQSHLQNLD